MGFYHGPLRGSSRTVARMSPTELFSYCLLAIGLSAVVIAVTLTSARRHYHASRHALEEPHIASPRTPWSSRKNSSRTVEEQIAAWHSWQQVLAKEASQWSGGSGKSLLLLGDSITESWRGTSYGRPVDRAAGVPAVFQQTLAARWPNPQVFAISGDQTQHVLWRLERGGELSPRIAMDPGLLIALLIGTNNLGKHTAEATHDGIVTIARLLLNRTRGKILVNALLPRGDPVQRYACPPHGPQCAHPLRSFLPAIRRVNQLLAASVPPLAREHPGRIAYVDCGAPFLTHDVQEAARLPPHKSRSRRLGLRGGTKRGLAASEANTTRQQDVRLELMPDKLHPGAEGHRLMARCLEEALAAL